MIWAFLRMCYPVILLTVWSNLPSEDLYGQATDDIKFSALTSADGLSQSSVNAILKDRYGFMWFGTQDGLNRYDGYTFHVYRNNPHRPGSIPDNQIKCLYEDGDANIWIGTLGGGLCIYDRSRDVFVRPEEMGFHTDQPLDPAILSIYEDHERNLWVGTFQDLLLIDRKTKIIRHFQAKAGDTSGLSNGIIQAIFEDAYGRLWIGTNKGLDLFNKQAGTFSHFFHNDKDPFSISSDQVTTITGDRQGHLWIGTNGGGLDLLDTRTGRFSNWKKSADVTSPAFRGKNLTAGRTGSISSNIVRALSLADSGKLWVGTEEGLDLLDESSGRCTHYKKRFIGEGSLSDNSILSLKEDANGILWVGTSAGGINRWDRNLFYFDLYRKTADPNSLSADKVTSFAEGPEGEIWIGTDGGGLNCWQQGTQRFLHFQPDPANKDAIEGYVILSLLISRDKKVLWIGTYGDGLQQLDLSTGKFSHYHAGPGLKELSSAFIYSLLEDKAGNIWMGTNGGGLDVLHPGSGLIDKHLYAAHPDSISNNYIRCLMEDREGRIWIGTYSSGISLYDPGTGKFSLYDKMNNNLSHQVVFSLCQDASGRIWAGTMGGGLDLFDPHNRRFTAFTEEDGLSNNIVNRIIEDDKGKLWLSTNKGISQFDPAKKTCRNFSVYNGLQAPEFMIGSGYRSAEGKIFFGGVNGFNVFDPAEERHNRLAPVTRFTDFSLFNQPVSPGSPGSPLKGDLNEENILELTHAQSDFTIGFAALSFTAPEANRYAYKLEGFDKDWNYSSERRATYTNLSPGKYVFQVKAANNDGIWADKSSDIIIYISPPFWKTWWAYLLYALTIFLILYFIYKDISDKEKLKAQIRIERLTAEKMKELNAIKLNFFTNVSHELRTPLSLIIDPLRKIIREDLSRDDLKRYGGLMYNNAQRLMNLINQMLDFRKLEEGHLQLNLQTANIVTLIRNIAPLFEVHAMERKIRFTVTATEPYIPVKVDQDKFEKIIFNLLSNAFKYTPEKGAISLIIEKEDKAVVHFRDTGIGIPENLKEKVFELFYQVEDARGFEKGSTGIGLALTKELVELHGGQVSVESVLGKGSDFILRLPLAEVIAPAIDPVDGETDQSDKIDKTSEKADVQPNSIQDLPDEANGKELLLLVEDNMDLREYIKGELEGLYNVEAAANGAEGYEKAVADIPDLIISDIMMPEVTGLELCRQVKLDERTSHIPVILLTARQADVHQVEGYDAGADVYIPKPFSMEVVLSCIKSQLESRRRLRERYDHWKSPERTEIPPAPLTTGASQTAETGPASEMPFPSEMGLLDREFLQKATAFIEGHLSDTTFDIDKLALLLKVSRRQLYRKLKALTNRTAHDFVTGIRLQKAAALLVTGEYNIAEVAYKTGYSEPANFSRSFTKEFGKSPKRYLAEYGK